MRKVAAIFSIIFGVGVLYISTSKNVMKEISAVREAAPWHSWWGPHQVDNSGDLARMAYLENVEKFQDTTKRIYVRAGDGNKKVNLYIWGDSYVKDIPDSAYYGLRSFKFARRGEATIEYDLDTQQNNILIIALGERFLRSYFYTPDDIFDKVKKSDKVVINRIFFPLQHSKHYAGLADISVNSFFNPAINQNIEYNLFTYNFMTPVRAFKAEMNALLFQRGSGDVIISDDGTLKNIQR